MGRVTFGLLAAMLGLVPSLLIVRPARAADAAACDAKTQAGTTCACDVRTLRPLQGAVGLEEVRDKVRRITVKPDKEWRELEEDPIKVVRGPGDQLFITDHHHGADAWRLFGRPVAVCQIEPRPAFGTEAQFWSGLVADRLVRLADADGKPLTPAQLPASLEAMPDDPYRSLAGQLRINGGFCRSIMGQTEFAEFLWADWMRTRPELPVASVRASAVSMVPTALTLARSDAAREIPGYVGDKPANFVCPKEP